MSDYILSDYIDYLKFFCQDTQKQSLLVLYILL